MGWDIHLMTYFLYTQYEIIDETLDYKAIDFLSDFGGYLGLFIGASLLYLYDVFANFFLRLLTTKLGRNEETRMNNDKTV